MKIIGLTGSIASGKSAAEDYMRQKGASIICADRIARDVVRRGTPGNRVVREAFGAEFFLPGGRLDRKKLGRKVFNDPQALLQLNALLHPLITKAVIQKLRRCRRKVAVVSAALLIEAGWDRHVDEVWMVEADDVVRLERLVNMRGMSREDALAVMQTQMPQAEKRRHATVVLENSTTLENLYKQIDAAWETITPERGIS